MEQFVINGPTKLKGTVKISGSKNASLPIIAATVLVKGVTILKNIPKIRDVTTLLDVLSEIGVKSSWTGNVLEINTKKIKKLSPNDKKIRNLRASILLVAPLLVRNKTVSVPHPGGCLIGSRPIDVHLDALAILGAKSSVSRENYILSATRLRGTNVCAEFSVTGTENIIMAAVLSEGVTNIFLAAAEPHVQDLCRFLNKAGAKIKGVGTHNLVISGVKKLNSVSYTVIPDQIEAGTFAIAALATKGEVLINGFVCDHHQSLISKLRKSGANFKIITPRKAVFYPTHQFKPFKIKTEVYPGFPTDLQAPIAVLATQAEGTSEIYETIFEGRLGYINELSKMGASCIIRDAHQASITGPTPLYGTRITSFDLRAGATLVIAALLARGESRLDQIEIIDRGYEKIESKLGSLGAKIKRISLKEIE